MENDKPFHLKITQEDGPRLNGVALAGAVSKNGTWMVAIPADYVEFEVTWTFPAVAALSPQATVTVPATRSQAPAPQPAPQPAPPATPEPKPLTPVQFVAAPKPEEPKAAPSPAPGLPSDAEVALLHEGATTSAEIAEAFGVTEQEVKDAVRRAVKAKVPIPEPTARKELRMPEGMDPDVWERLQKLNVTHLNLHGNAVMVLHGAGIDTIAHLIMYRPRELQAIPGLGPSYVRSIVSALTDAHLTLPADDLEIKDVCQVRRSLGGLHAEGITTVEQLCEHTRAQLLRIDGVSAKVVDDMEAELAKHGRSLRA